MFPNFRGGFLKILYDARILKKENSGGVVEFLIRLLEFLSKKKTIKISLICRKEIDKDYAPFFKNFSIINVGSDTAGINTHNIELEEKLFPKIIKKETPDIYHAPFNWGCTDKINIKKVQTIHDLIPFEINEDMSSSQLRLYKNRIKQSAKTADKIIAVSKYTKEDIIKKLKINRKKIEVIYNGLDKDIQIQKPSDSLLSKIDQNQYFIQVGGLYQRKNISLVLKSFDKFIKKYSDFKLLITGSISGNKYIKDCYQNYLKEIKKLNLQQKIIFTDYIKKEEVNYLIKNSVALLYPSLYEGFGLPVLEGMSLDIPVITSNTTALQEIAGDSAIKVDPKSEQEILNAMQRVYLDSNIRKTLIKKGKNRIKDFSWSKMGQQYLQIYKNLLKGI